MRKRIFTGLVTLCLILTLVPAFTGSARADYTANGVSLPVSGYGEGAVSNNCRTFAGDVYQAVWGAWLTSYRGTDDDMLRNIPAGSQRAITAENLKKYISVAPAGAAIRITDNIDGNDSQGTRMHSQILADKDEDGLMIYEGNIGGRVRMKYFTWDSYVQSWGKYVYFKYIKFPDAPAYSAGSGSGGNGWQSAYFWDVPSSAWYSGDVAWTSAAGLVSGKGGGTYGPLRQAHLGRDREACRQPAPLVLGGGREHGQRLAGVVEHLCGLCREERHHRRRPRPAGRAHLPRRLCGPAVPGPALRGVPAGEQRVPRVHPGRK